MITDLGAVRGVPNVLVVPYVPFLVFCPAGFQESGMAKFFEENSP
jgi:hypothetical protein